MQRLGGDVESPYQYRYFGGFRLLLAVLVMVQHFGADLAPAPLAVALAPYSVGSVAVLVFFALSGFVITEAVDTVYRTRPGPFLANRLLRILPHFLLAVILAMLAHEFFRLAGGVRLWRSQPSFPDDAFAWPNLLLNLFAIVPGAKKIMDYNFLSITWALRVEMAFYLAMFLCIAIGRRLPGPRGFAVTASVLLILALALIAPIIHGHGPEMLGFIPYFAFGGGLYFATMRSGAGWVTVLVSTPIMLWQFIEDQARTAPIQGIPLSLRGSLIVLVVLLGITTALAFSRIEKGRTIDRMLGNLTYPLYLYHEVVLIVILTLTTGYAYITLALGIALSFGTAAILMALVDPTVTLFRDRVRGSALRRVDADIKRPTPAIAVSVRVGSQSPL
jgi:peptidoglycan/LPS O-acetylase OafA/YrhL